MSKKEMPKLSTKKQIEFDVLCKTLIGKNIKIVDSKNKNQIGLEGVLIYESSNLFYLKVDNKVKRILKNNVVIEFELDSKIFKVNGAVLANSLVSRIKKIK